MKNRNLLVLNLLYDFERFRGFPVALDVNDIYNLLVSVKSVVIDKNKLHGTVQSLVWNKFTTRVKDGSSARFVITNKGRKHLKKSINI